RKNLIGLKHYSADAPVEFFFNNEKSNCINISVGEEPSFKKEIRGDRVVNGVLQTIIKHITRFWSAPEWVICFIINWSTPLTTLRGGSKNVPGFGNTFILDCAFIIAMLKTT
ncbi:4878_t:CDS:1, partial [Ambispora leptoticha]